MIGIICFYCKETGYVKEFTDGKIDWTINKRVKELFEMPCCADCLIKIREFIKKNISLQ